MSFSPRRVKSTPTVALYELRLLRSSMKPALVLRYIESKVKKWRGVQRWYLQSYSSARGELITQAVVERPASLSRVDNLLQAWRKLVVKMLPSVQVKQLKRGFWHQDTLVDIRFMAETWENACSKLGAEATVDHNAAKCSYLEPTLPPVSQSVPSNTKELVTPKAKDLNIPPKEIPKSISNETGRSLHVHLQQKV